MSLNCLDGNASICGRGITGKFLWVILLSFLYVCWLIGCGDTNNATAPPPDAGPGPLTIDTTSLPDGTVNQPYGATLGATGGITPYTWSTTPALPSNLTFNPATGAITGAPAGQGTTSHTFTVQDSSSPVQTEHKSLSLRVNAAQISPTITTGPPTGPPLPIGIVNERYSATTLQAIGGTPPLIWDPVVRPALPNGLSWDAATHTISGVPLNGSQGTTSHTFTVRDSANLTATKALALTIISRTPPNITTTSASLLPDGTVSTLYSRTLRATGGAPPLTWKFSGALPTGVTLNPNNGVISGIPSATGTFDFTPQVTDAFSLTDQNPPALSITIK
ncbi:MAG TPA: putative Ig domain-containing protein [Nitrospiraceae bacterium]|nr:putative Ig domain-containing protein [Nitrospiraceae bacterium]